MKLWFGINDFYDATMIIFMAGGVMIIVCDALIWLCEKMRSRR